MAVTPRVSACPLLLRVVALAALALGATGAGAAWVAVGESDSTAYYVDPDSMRTDGARRRVWRLFDLKAVQADGVRSGKALIDIDCEAGTYRYLKTMYYSEPMGGGRYLGGRGEHRKEHVVPGTLIGQLATLACRPAGDAPARK